MIDNREIYIIQWCEINYVNIDTATNLLKVTLSYYILHDIVAKFNNFFLFRPFMW